MPHNKKNRSKAERNGLGLRPSVSLVTITQYDRRDFLPMIVDMIQAQDYPNIIEWILIDGTPSRKNRGFLHSFLDQDYTQSLQDHMSIYIHGPDSSDTRDRITRAELRNIANENVQGDVIVCIDDDDYYPPTRVSHAVKQFQKHPKKWIAGCSPVILYDFETSRLYQFRHYGENHSINTCMAYRKEYLDAGHYHDPNDDQSEESSFTNKFREPMIQLAPQKTCIHFSHSLNSVSKRYHVEKCLSNGGESDSLKLRMNESLYTIPHVDPIIIDRYLQAFSQRFSEESNYDVTIYCGAFQPLFPPTTSTTTTTTKTDASLDGTDASVVEMAQRIAAQGYTVEVYCQLDKSKPDNTDHSTPSTPEHGTTYQNAIWWDYQTFPLVTHYSTLVLWGESGVTPWLMLPLSGETSTELSNILSAQQLYVNILDNDPRMFQFLYKKASQVTGFFVKSRAQWRTSVELQSRLPLHKTIIVPNGIRSEYLSLSKSDARPVREWCRLCYVAEHPYGLKPFLENAWPIIRNTFRYAEFHVYHGLDKLNQNAPVVKSLKELLKQGNGIVDHGRQPSHVVAMEKQRSNLDIHIMDGKPIADPVCVRESIVTGCIPVISNDRVFAELEGYHVALTNDQQQQQQQQNQEQEANVYQAAGESIVGLLQDPEKCERIRSNTTNALYVDWDRASVTWTKVFREQDDSNVSLEQVRPCLSNDLNNELWQTFEQIVYIPTQAQTYSVSETVGLDTEVITKVHTDYERLDTTKNRLSSDELVFEALAAVADQDPAPAETDPWYFFITSDSACDMSTFQRIWPTLRDALNTYKDAVGIVHLGGGSHLKQFDLQPLYKELMQKQTTFVYTHNTSLPPIADILFRRYPTCFMVTYSVCCDIVHRMRNEKDQATLEACLHSWNMDDSLTVTDVLPHPFYLRDVT